MVSNLQNMQKYTKANKALWNKRTSIHLKSEMYNMSAFLKGATSLKSIELALLGNVKDKKILHLQCHFGQDTLSLARMGAKVTGLDLSDKAIETAQNLNQELGLDAQFVCCDILEADQYITEKFDLVFTTYGTIGWLPSLEKWGQLIAHFLKPKGQLVFVEFHPVMWTLDDATFTKIEHSYFNVKTFLEIETTTYSDGPSHEPLASYSWNHPFTEVFQSLLSSNLQIQSFQEYDTSPYNCFPNTVAVEGGFQIKGLEKKLPIVYSIVASR